MTKKISMEDFAKDRVLRAHREKSLEVARALDAKADVLPHTISLTSIELESFVSELTPKRVQLLRLAIKSRQSIGELAAASNRDPSAVSKDVSRLQMLGLVKVDSVVNPGHGVKKIVRPVANRITIDADLEPA